jgi:hypothetical protein
VTEDEDMDDVAQKEPLDDLDDEEGEEEGEDEEDPSESEENQSNLHLSLENKRKAKLQRKKEILSANRALRIKMGKSGAQAASRRSIKKGKDACQRKLWNLDVSKFSQLNHTNWLCVIEFKSR